jgi:hypothetical protein
MRFRDYFTLFGAHKYCSDDSCRVQCISNLELNINLYLDELSRVFFKKENLKTRDGYWVSAFYSFCIQATVRKILRKMSVGVEYLRLAINLFIASSGTYDPLTTNHSADHVGHVSDHEDIALLKEALGSPVTSSADYLRKLFEIGGV